MHIRFVESCTPPVSAASGNRCGAQNDNARRLLTACLVALALATATSKLALAQTAPVTISTEAPGLQDYLRLLSTTGNAAGDGQRISFVDKPDANVVVGAIDHIKTGPGIYEFRLWNWNGAGLVQDMVITGAGNIGIGTAAPAVGGVVAGRTYLTVQGTAGAGVIEMTTTEADANVARVGVVQFTDKNSLNSSDKRIATIVGALDGTTANNRGGALSFGTKPDGGSIAERVRISKEGNFGIGTAAPAAQLHTTGSVRFEGVSGVGTAGCLANDTSGNITAGAGPCRSGVFYPIVTCNGVVDNTTAIQASIEAAVAAGGAAVELPAGACLSGTLTIGTGVWLRGQSVGSARAGVYGSSLVAKPDIANLINVTGYNVRISTLALQGNATSGWAINNDPGNDHGNSGANPTLVTDIAINGFSQPTKGGVINSSGSINIERNLFHSNCFHFYSFNANVDTRFIKNSLQFGGECGFQAVWTNNGASNEGHIIRDNKFAGSQGEGATIHTCVLCFFENNVIGNTVGTRDLAVDDCRSCHIIGNYFDKPVTIGNLTASWFMRNSMANMNGLTVTGPHTLIMFNQFSTACNYGGNVTALINTGDASCNTTTSVPSTW